jgi:hypothetical protein
MEQKPTFIGVGGHKCASTWMSECLREHPSVFMSDPKEIGYFTLNFKKGLEWYLDFFKDAKSFKEKGEFSATYLYNAEIPNKIMDQLGPVKIICLVRNPIERTISHLKQLNRKNLLKLNSNKFSLKELYDVEEKFPDIINYSLYKEGIMNYQKTFGKENVLILDQSHLKKNSDGVLKILFNFLEIDSYNLKTSSQIISKGIVPKYKVLEKIRIKTYDFLYHNNPSMISFIKKMKIGEFYRKINNKESSNSFTLDNECILYLENKFKEDWEKTLLLTHKVHEV